MKIKCYRIVTYGFTILFLMIFLFNTGSTIFADSGEISTKNSNRAIRVGISDFPYFMEDNKDGSYHGIVIDYINEIAKYTGWQIEYVKEEADKLLDMLSNGDVDIMGCMYKNDDTVDLFNFSEFSSGFVYSTLITKKQNEKFIAGDYDSFDGMKVGAYKLATTRIAAFNQFNRYNALGAEIILYDSANEWNKDFNSGKLDAILTNSVNLKPDEKIIANFSIEPFYFAVTKGRSDITRELNNALVNISQIKPQFEANLYKKYFGLQEKDILTLTSAEQKFIESSTPLRVVMAPDWAPISEINQKNNDFNGISIDFLKLISKKTGLKFEFIPTKSFKESFELINSGKADIIAGIFDTPFVNKSNNFTFSLPYFPTQTMIIHLKNTQISEKSNSIIAMPYGFEYMSNFKNVSMRYYDSVNECLKAVENKEADFTTINNLAVENYLRKHGKGRFVMTPSLTSALELSIAIANPVNPQLLSIIDKTIYSIGEDEKQAIVLDNTSIENSKVSFISYIYSNPTQAIHVVAVGSLIIIAVLFFVMQMRIKLSEKVAYMSEAYRLIGEFSDEYIFEYSFDSEELKLPEEFADLIKHNMIVRSNEHNIVLGNLISSFDKNNLKPKFTTEFLCTVSSGEQEWFRAICAVLYDSHKKPIKGIGKIVNIQNEFTLKQVLEEKANTDALTGLYNKMHCEQLIHDYFASNNQSHDAVMLIIDCDRFKQVNDTLGHLGGDKAIVFLANTLREIFDTGVLGRWGGDEFIAFIENVVNRSSIIEKVKLFCKTMDTEFAHESNKCHISVSVGVAFTDKNSNYKELFHNADEALYDVKRGSRNGYKVFEINLP